MPSTPRPVDDRPLLRGSGGAVALALAVSVGLALATGLHASSYVARTWQVDDGLPDNRVTGLAQTPDGYLWVSTRGGLSRFNGANFEVFPLSAVTGVIGSGATGVFADSRGILWLGAHRETLLRVAPESAKVLTKSEGLPSSPAIGFAEGRGGEVWLAFPGAICRWDGARLQPLASPEGLVIAGRPSLANDRSGEVWCGLRGRIGVIRNNEFQLLRQVGGRDLVIAASRQGGVWVCTESQVIRLDASGKPLQTVDRTEGSPPDSALEAVDGSLWIGSATEGLSRFDGEVFEKVEISHRHVTSLLEDSEGNLWVGTFGGGLDRVRPRAFNLLGEGGGLPFESVTSVTQEANGTLWAVGRNGQVAKGQDSTWTVMPDLVANQEGAGACLVADRDGTIWIGTSGQGLLEFNPSSGLRRHWRREQGLPSNSVRALLVARDGSIYVASNSPARLSRIQGGRLQALAGPEGIRNIRALAETRPGEIWAGTSDGKVLRVRGDALVDEPAMAWPRTESVRCLHGEPDGGLWIGYAGAGVGYFKDGHYGRIAAAEGLPENSIAQIATDLSGSLWLAGTRGYYRLPRDEAAKVAMAKHGRLRVTLYGRADGLPSLQPHYDNTPSVCAAPDGRLWFATSRGILGLDPRRIRDNPTPPPVVLEQVSVDDRTVATRGRQFPLHDPVADAIAELEDGVAVIPLAPDHRRVEFRYAALSYSAPENVRLRYRLDGFDDDWTEVVAGHTAQYPRLAAGDYTFRVVACNEAGAWNERGARVALSVAPFVWQTWWFRLGILVAFTGGVAGLVRWVSVRRLERQLRRAEQQAALFQERTRIARDIHDDLGGSLSHIKLLSEIAAQDRNSPEAAGESFAQITRATQEVLKSLDETIWAINPRNDTLPNLISYLGQYSMTHLRAAGITCRIDLPDAPPELPVPSDVRHHVFLATKEALTNVIRHARAGEVRLQATVERRQLTLAIADNGQGFAAAPDDALADGLRNMRQRLEAVGGSCTVSSSVGGGTRIEFHVPLSPEP